MCIVDKRANRKIIDSIETLGYEVVLMPSMKNVSESCKSHPDISLFRISNSELIYAKGCDGNFLSLLKEKGITLIEGNSLLSHKYPDDIKYNAAIIGNYLVHKLNSTDSKIFEKCIERNIKPLNVRQGYSCCSIAKVRENLAITSDLSIYKALENTEIEILLIPPQKSIVLTGADYGFIGGASGRVNDQVFAIAGNAEYLESYCEIRRFLDKRGVRLISLSDEKPVDLGTLMFFTL